MSEMAVPISVLNNAVLSIHSDTYVGIPEPHTFPSVNLAVARTLTTIQGGKGVFRVVNPTDNPVLLDGGCPLGQVFAVVGQPYDEYTVVSLIKVSARPACPTPPVFG